MTDGVGQALASWPEGYVSLPIAAGSRSTRSVLASPFEHALDLDEETLAGELARRTPTRLPSPRVGRLDSPQHHGVIPALSAAVPRRTRWRKGDTADPVLHVVVYNGDSRWDAPLTLAGLVARTEGVALPSIREYEEVSAVLANKIDRWGAEILERGIKQGIEQEKKRLCRLAERRFGAAAAERLAAALAGVTDADRLAEAGEWIVDCATTADFLARVGRAGS